jgi:outer membrane protein TolC
VKLSLAERFAATYARYRNAQQQVDRYGRRLPDTEVNRILSLAAEERQKELEKYAQILPRAQIALALATEGWRRGEFAYLQVLTAQRTLAQASIGSVRAHAELRQSAVILDGYLLTDGLAGSGSGPSGGSDQ